MKENSRDTYPNISLKEMTHETAKKVVDYFSDSSSEFLIAMGAEPSRLPSKSSWVQSFLNEIEKPIDERNFYHLIWHLDSKPIGHCNINHIQRGGNAFMHLHMWSDKHRGVGLGSRLLPMCIDRYFELFQIKEIICEPFHLNKASAATISKIGFEFEKKYKTIPGPLCDRQFVNRYILTREKWQEIKSQNRTIVTNQ